MQENGKYDITFTKSDGSATLTADKLRKTNEHEAVVVPPCHTLTMCHKVAIGAGVALVVILICAAVVGLICAAVAGPGLLSTCRTKKSGDNCIRDDRSPGICTLPAIGGLVCERLCANKKAGDSCTMDSGAPKICKVPGEISFIARVTRSYELSCEEQGCKGRDGYHCYNAKGFLKVCVRDECTGSFCRRC